MPADGASGDCEWNGMIPFEDLPHFYNPASGEIATANQNPFPFDYQYPVAGHFAAPYRAMEIRTLLDRSQKWQPEQMLAVEKDVYSMFSQFLAGQVVAAFDAQKSSNPAMRDAVDLLRSWNGQMEKGTPAPMVVSLVFLQLRKALAEKVSAGSGQVYEFGMATAVIEKLLRERPPGWFPDYNVLLMKCLSEGIDEGAKIQGSKVSRWDYGQYNAWTMTNPVEGHLPLVGTYFNIGPVSMSGGPTTIKQTTRRLGPSMRMIVDLSDLDHSFQNITVGESGHRLSRHYKDQWNAYYGATSFPMQFGKIDARQTLTVISRQP